MKRTAKPQPPKTLPPVRPNVGTQAKYRKQLEAIIKEMNDSVEYWVRAAYKNNEPVIATDALPTAVLERVVRRLQRRWQKKFDELAPKLAQYYAQAANTRSALQLQNALREGGMTVKFKMTRAARDVMNASIQEQVGLIKSIPQKYFTAIQGDVMRSVQSGRDLATLTKSLQENYGVTKRRAANIARDQNNKATASMTRVRQQEIGVVEAIWLHSGGGKHPRPKHKAFNGKRYNVKEGAPIGDKGQKVHPGEEINCRCVSRAIIPGFS